MDNLEPAAADTGCWQQIGLSVMRTLVVIATLIGIMLLAFPAAAQSIGGPHKTINQIGGAKPVVNQVVAAPRHVAAPSAPESTAPPNRSAGAAPKTSVK